MPEERKRAPSRRHNRRWTVTVDGVDGVRSGTVVLEPHEVDKVMGAINSRVRHGQKNFPDHQATNDWLEILVKLDI